MARPIGTQMPSPPLIHAGSRCALGGQMRISAMGQPASGVSPWSDAADFVLGFPFFLEQTTTFYKVFWINGSAAGNTSDVAIFADDGTFIVSTNAATAGSGNSVPQAVALSATTTLPPGAYHCGMSHNATTTNQLVRWSQATTGGAFLQAMGCWKSGSSDTPAITSSVTFADLTNVAFPVFGLITRSVFDL